MPGLASHRQRIELRIHADGRGKRGPWQSRNWETEIRGQKTEGGRKMGAERMCDQATRGREEAQPTGRSQPPEAGKPNLGKRKWGSRRLSGAIGQFVPYHMVAIIAVNRMMSMVKCESTQLLESL